MSKLTNVKPKQGKPNILTYNKPKKTGVNISFKYLSKCNVCCLESLSKFDSKNKEKHIFKDLQDFLYEAENYCETVESMISMYTSKSGSKISVSNSLVKSIVNKFIQEYPDDKGLFSDSLIHIHTKRNGKGAFVIFGVSYESTFYVLGFDPDHSFNSK